MSNEPLPSAASHDALTHELRVHQIELEQQNEELQRAQSDLAAAHDRYRDLYDFAPVGYCTLDAQGCIVKINLTGAGLLGQPRAALQGKPLARFVSQNDADRWHLYLRWALGRETPQRIDLTMNFADGTLQWFAAINSVRVLVDDGMPTLRVSITDVTDRMRSEVERRIAAIDADARESERRRLALELHEDLGQRLSALKMHLAELPDGPGHPMAAHKAALQGEIDQAVSLVRRITSDLRPPMLDDLGLGPAMEWLAKDMARRLNMKLTLSLDNDHPPLGRALSLALYRFFQEALSYLLHETNATDLVIEVRRPLGQFVLSMRARGTDLKAPWRLDTRSEPSLILEHRARLLGGRLSFDTTPDGAGWIGLKLTQNLGLNETPVDHSGRPS
ncbi:PAS domain-containing sensor histidine kinase [Hydrogenophaga sp. PBL-H3]|uniref:PAS domain-containing sensor histidine kinase n=1 Tax=Hydrogenophaga sp. PBL-H3 TaxID=434010 RepID=UPI00135BF4CB|nr:PAS domain S-box protein [Hydrogenophaga sp. PBL-H3]